MVGRPTCKDFPRRECIASGDGGRVVFGGRVVVVVRCRLGQSGTVTASGVCIEVVGTLGLTHSKDHMA